MIYNKLTMNGLLFLSSDDFYVNETTQNGRLLNCNINQGLCLILFYSTQCAHSQRAMPVFKRLPYMIHGCTFAMINVSVNAKAVHMSKTTISPITYVPILILYFNGEPMYKYTGIFDIQEIQRFILQMSKNLQSKQQFVSNMKEETKKPEYTTGVPYCDENFCYLEFETAYKK